MNNADTTERRYFNGDEVRLTGEDRVLYGCTYHVAVFVEGIHLGEEALLLSDADSAADVARRHAEWNEQQAAFSRLHKLSNK